MRHAAAWIFGAVCPARDTGVALVLPEATTPGMQLLLEEVSQAVAPDAHAVLILDRAGWHTARKLTWPANVSPMHLPPYSPELNGIERVWLYLKERFLSPSSRSLSTWTGEKWRISAIFDLEKPRKVRKT